MIQLQEYCNITTVYSKYHQSKSAEVLHNLSLQTTVPNFKLVVALLQTSSSGVSVVTLLQHLNEVSCPKATQPTRRHFLQQQRSCSKAQNRLAHEPHLQQGFNKP
jgi:hypothetical protein